MLPGEIEEILIGHPDVEEVCVIVIEEEQDPRMVACIRKAEAAALTSGDAEEYCNARLKSFHNSCEYLILEQFPKTPTGITSRRRLVAMIPDQDMLPAKHIA